MTEARPRKQLYLAASAANGQPRTERFMARDFLVVPAVLVQSQILHNNLGDTFLPPEAFTDDWAKEWNGAPVIIHDHPSVRGVAVTARSPEVFNDRCVGYVFHTVVDKDDAGNPRLKAEVWLDNSRAAEIAELDVILSALRSGQPVELSTGFATLAEERAGVHNGDTYDLVIHPEGADHLAIFATKKGACSVDDGCGLGVNKLLKEEGGVENKDKEKDKGKKKPDTSERGQFLALMNRLVDGFFGKPPCPQAANAAVGEDRTCPKCGYESVPADATKCPDCGAEMPKPADRGDDGAVKTKAAKNKAGLPNCPECGVSVDEDAKVCPSCGAAIVGNDTLPLVPSSKPKKKDNTPKQTKKPMSDEAPKGKKMTRTTAGYLARLQKAGWDTPAIVGLMSAVRNAEDYPESDDEMRNQLYEELNEQYGGAGRMVWVEAVYGAQKEVVFCVVMDGLAGRTEQMYRATYSVDGEEIAFASPTEVERRIVYEPVGNSKPEGSAMSEKKQEEPVAGSAAGAGAAVVNADAAKVADQLLALQTRIEAQDKEIASLKSTVKPTVEAAEAERKQLVTELAANKSCAFNQAELESMPVDQLRKIAAMAGGTSFAGRGGPRQVAANTEEAQYAEPVPYWLVPSDKGKTGGAE